MLFGLTLKETIIGGMSLASLGLGAANTIMNVKTSKQVKSLRGDMDKYVLKPAQAQQSQQAVAASAAIQQGVELLNKVAEQMEEKEAEKVEAEKVSDGDGASLDAPPMTNTTPPPTTTTPPPTTTTPPPTPPPATEDGAKKGKK